MNAVDSYSDPEMSSDRFHGGNPDWAERRFGRPAAGWIDLSTGINPWTYPFAPVAAGRWSQLPTEAELEALRRAAAARYGAPGPQNIALAPGSQALIQWLPRLRARSTVAVVSPTYSEHFAAWEMAGHSVIRIASPEEIDDNVDVVVLTNPNNPDGKIHSPTALRTIRSALANRGGWLVIDEAFADVAPEISLAADCDAEALIVLRSFGKFYGLAGLRLGVAVAAAPLSSRLAAAIGPWPVSGPAIDIGIQAYEDSEWTEQTRHHLRTTCNQLDSVIAESGLEVTGGTLLFRYARGREAHAVFERLGHAGILVRHFPENETCLRFGLPADDAALERLRAAIRP